MVNVRDVISSIIFYGALIVALMILVRIGRTYGWAKVDEQFREMEIALPRGHYVWINKRARTPDRIQHNDFIVYTRPPWKRIHWDKEFGRVIGLPGDLVRMRRGKIYRSERGRDGALSEEEMLTEHYTLPYQLPQDFSEFIVPRNCVFVMFDQRRGRQQLRNLIVPARAIQGKVIR